VTSSEEFRELMERLARAWSTRDTELGLSCFAEDAVYIEPPDVQLFIGHEQLRPYFAALTTETMRFHTLAFDEASQRGAGEYSFGTEGEEPLDHGVAIVEIADGRIAVWREYQRKGPSSFAEFTATDGKTWQWHIGNYP
jgi:ketosteroid isomerase-like protein